MDFPANYRPKDHEDKIYELWEKSGFFNPDRRSKPYPLNPKPYSIILPPPNVTGSLHMGHAAMLAVEDILIRFERMRGKRTLWLPGTDHAAIATQEKVERELYKKEKKTRHDLGREKFLDRVNAFARESHNTIVHQMKKMGASLDWSREAFTLDEPRSLAVRTAFKKMYDAELIYRGHRIVNWDPKLGSTVSDDEIEWIEQKTPFYYLKYGPFTIATARPETKFGDKYVVMHPDDKRYAKYKPGENIKLEWINGPITATIIKDDSVDMEFGTGVMTITPWHDATDFDIAERHKLDKEQIIDFKGLLLPIAGEFAGQHIKKARAMIVEKLKAKGLLEKIDEHYGNRIATNPRGGGVIEPQIKEQWFVDVNKEFVMPNPLSGRGIDGIKPGTKTTLKKLMQTVIRSGQITIHPKRFEKTYFDWIDNLRDWCISRQIWYGHRIPVWYHEPRCVPAPGKEKEMSKCKDLIVSDTEPKCEFCKAKFIQDPDTLDTWFSSGLWTLATLGWPNETDDLENFHPTSVLETGYDIIFFWVARMILMTGFLLGDVPFKDVYLHGMVRDAQGQKMSKSLGNTIDPLIMSEKYGADATRLSLIIGAAPGNDIKLSEDKIRGYRNFATKIWNAARFVIMNTEDYDPAQKPEYTASDKKIIMELESLKKELAADIEKFNLHRAAEKLYHYFWHTFADKIIEGAKPRLLGNNPEDRAAAQSLLVTTLTACLKMLHPFVPFVTEAIWQALPENVKDSSQLLMIEKW